MGILNLTPDSFSDGGEYFNYEKAVDRALQMEAEGADFIDIGGESSRPGADPVTADEEIERVLPVIEALSGRLRIPISVDTTKAEVAGRSLEAGAQIVNDISAGQMDAEMLALVAEKNASVILMHMLGDPHTMQQSPTYDNLIGEVHQFLLQRVEAALGAGITADRILVDPGIGFGKRLHDNFEILGRLSEFADLAPLVVGPSRKSFIGKTLDLPIQQRLLGTAAAVAVAVYNGADVLRVHDVREMKQVIRIASECLINSEKRN